MEKDVNGIIADLTNDQVSLETILLKTKVLGYTLKNQDLVDWVNQELNGYKLQNDLPNYRIHEGTMTGLITNGHQSMKNVAIPLHHLKKEVKNSLLDFSIYDSISAIEDMKKSNPPVLVKNTQADALTLINFNLPVSNSAQVIGAQTEIGAQVLSEILTSVRSKLLDFLLQLGTKVDLYKDEELKNNEDISKMVHTIIKGDNNVVISGDSNKQKVKISNDKALEKLMQLLSDNAVAKEDIEEIKAILLLEKEEVKLNRIDSWVLKMLDKAKEGSWDISVAVAAQLLGSAFQAYLNN